MRKTQICLSAALIGPVVIGLIGCASEPTGAKAGPAPTHAYREAQAGTAGGHGDGGFDIFEFIEGDGTDEAEVTAIVEYDLDDEDAGEDVILAVPDITLLDVADFDEPAPAETAEVTMASGEGVENEQTGMDSANASENDIDAGEEAAPAVAVVVIEPLAETDDTESLVVGEDLVVHVVPVPAPQPARSGGRTVTFANSRSAPVPAAVFESIKTILTKAGFTVVGSAYGDYLVICGRIPPRTMGGRSSAEGASGMSYVRASSLAEPLRVPLDRPDGGSWQAIVEISFETDEYDPQQRLRLRELHTIFSGDLRKSRRRDAAGLTLLNDTLDAWAASYGTGLAKR